MTHEKRLDRLEDRMRPESGYMKFRACVVPKGLSQEEHDRYHEERGESCFTLNLGDCNVSTGDEE